MAKNNPNEQSKEKKPLTKRWWFWAIVIFLGLSVIYAAVGGGNNSENTVLASPSPTITAAPAPSGPSPEEIKAAALEADTTIWNLVIAAETEYMTFLETIQNSTNDLDSYNAAEEMKTSAENYRYMIGNVECPDIKDFRDYRLNALTYANTMADVADKAMEYIDDPITSKLSEFQDAMQYTQSWGAGLVTIRLKALPACGFTSEETAEIVASSYAEPESQD